VASVVFGIGIVYRSRSADAQFSLCFFDENLLNRNEMHSFCANSGFFIEASRYLRENCRLFFCYIPTKNRVIPGVY